MSLFFTNLWLGVEPVLHPNRWASRDSQNVIVKGILCRSRVEAEELKVPKMAVQCLTLSFTFSERDDTDQLFSSRLHSREESDRKHAVTVSLGLTGWRLKCLES